MGPEITNHEQCSWDRIFGPNSQLYIGSKFQSIEHGTKLDVMLHVTNILVPYTIGTKFSVEHLYNTI
jgi:hypothetical protein